MRAVLQNLWRSVKPVKLIGAVCQPHKQSKQGSAHMRMHAINDLSHRMLHKLDAGLIKKAREFTMLLRFLSVCYCCSQLEVCKSEEGEDRPFLVLLPGL